MNKTLIFLFLSYILILNSITHNVNQDDTMDFTTIQAAIDIASSGDTILVHPGTYYENLVIDGVGLNLMSLYEATQDTMKIHTTIIDGNSSGSCILGKNTETDTLKISGFTIQNGSGTEVLTWTEGGGINIENSTVIIANNFITENHAHSCGGINVWQCLDVTLSNNTITGNVGFVGIGGVGIGGTNINFDEINKNSIYYNHAPVRADINIRLNNMEPLDIPLRKATVANPKNHEVRYIYFFDSEMDSGDYSLDYNFSTEEVYIDSFINQDLYVSLEGDDNNDGLTPETPFKTIARATNFIASDTLNTKTIHLAPGEYTEETQIFPVNYWGAVNLIGSTEGETKLIFEEPNRWVVAFKFMSYLKTKIENITFTGEYTTGIDIQNSYNVVTNRFPVEINNCKFDNSTRIQLAYPNVKISNCIFNNNIWKSYFPSQENFPDSHITIKNSKLINSDSMFQFVSFYEQNNVYDIINCEFADNNNQLTEIWDAAGIELSANYLTAMLNVVNCTFANNHSNGGGGAMSLDLRARARIYNSIFWNNSTCDLNVSNGINNLTPTEVEIHNTSFTDGMNSINYEDNSVMVLDEDFGDFIGNPFFVGINDSLPTYSLRHYSPFIDRGTLDLPEHIILPDTDLAGNPRIYGETIDLGAYEWQGNIVSEDIIPVPQNELKIYPNPFFPKKERGLCMIEFTIADPGEVDIAIYNIRGQRIKKVMKAYTNPGTFTLQWNGEDDSNKLVSSGQYFVKIKQNGYTIVKKMMMVK